MTPAAQPVIMAPEVEAALRLVRLMLQRAQSHPTGYGFLQTSDAAEVGLITGDPSRWEITNLGRKLLGEEPA